MVLYNKSELQNFKNPPSPLEEKGEFQMEWLQPRRLLRRVSLYFYKN